MALFPRAPLGRVADTTHALPNVSPGFMCFANRYTGHRVTRNEHPPRTSSPRKKNLATRFPSPAATSSHVDRNIRLRRTRQQNALPKGSTKLEILLTCEKDSAAWQECRLSIVVPEWAAVSGVRKPMLVTPPLEA
jgi:hypothetical protein